MGIGNFPIEYVKSAPFLMSFMNYKVKDKIDGAMAGKKCPVDASYRNKAIRNMTDVFS